MKTYCNEAYEDLKNTLQATENEGLNSLQYTEKAFRLCRQSLLTMRERLLNHTFADTLEEIHFFKTIKPRFAAEMIYYEERFWLEFKNPGTPKESCEARLQQILDYFQERRELFGYYRLGMSHHDQAYFTRGANGNDLPPGPDTVIDPQFATRHSYTFARFMAYEKLVIFLKAQLNEKEMTESEMPVLHWTGMKVHLVELTYALHASGCVGNGHTPIREIIEGLGRLFNIEMKEFYRTFKEIRIRKGSRTRFIDMLQESLENYLEKGDE
ncbi:RteC domain-containing protein [Roseivirga sp. BDSF3-8]|uniref:RteC domain-containing protein n=1 Tax=Roseivirga sp. BDSF3-8 TaxID=3241598 RepID=UPI003532530C